MAYSRTLNHFTSMQELATIWASSTSYLLNQLVIENNFLYRCAVAHTSSGSFQTDLAAGNWERVSSAENGINWASSTYYVLNQLVIENDKLYKCLVAHTSSGSFITDLQAGDWVEISASEAGVFNYVGNPDAEVDTSGWSAYADAAGSQPVDGTGGSPNITWSRSTTTPLRGDADFNLVKDAANRQGQGVSYDFTIDNADLAKVLTVTFDYEVLSGTYATGDLTVYLIQDPSGTPVVIQPAGYEIQSATVGTKVRQIATFQTASNVTSYRLCLHVASVSASAYSLAVDNVVVGPQVVQYGAAVTEWKDWTPTGTWVSNATYTGKYRIVGDIMEFRVNVACSGAVTATGLAINLPSGFSIDTSKLVQFTAGVGSLGYGSALNAGTSFHGLLVNYGNTTSVGVYVGNTAGTYITNGNVSNTVPFTFGAGDAVDLVFSAPILGLGATVQMSSDTDTRVVAVRAEGDPASATANNPIIVPTVGNDTHGAYSNITGRFTAPVPGFYVFQGFLSSAGTGVTIRLYVNSVNVINIGQTDSNGEASFVGMYYLNAGQQAWIGTTTTFDAQDVDLSIFRLSGPSAIAASETVAAAYTTVVGTVISAGVITKIPFATKDYDTHGAFVTDTFTAPVSGLYDCFFKWSSATMTLGTSQANSAYIYKNNSTIVALADVIGSGGSAVPSVAVRYVVRLLAGETIDFRARSSTNTSLQTNAGYNWFNITRVGNY